MKLTAPLALLLLLATGGSAAAAETSDATLWDPGWSLLAYGSASVIDEAGEIYQVRVGGQRHWANGLALELSGMVGGFHGEPIGDRSEGAEGVVAGFDVILRWHYHRAASWAAYLDVGGGAMWFDQEFPTYNGTSFNFEPQAGFGFEHRVGERTWLIWGARWHHVSNGDLFGKDENRGYDAVMPYLGVAWRP